MKYQIEYCPNPEVIQIHVDRTLTKKIIESWDSPDQEDGILGDPFDDHPMPAPVKEMFDLEGLEGISMKRYNFQFMKGVVFSWNDLIPQLLAIVKKYYSPEEELAEAAPARRMILDARGCMKDVAPEMANLLDE